MDPLNLRRALLQLHLPISLIASYLFTMEAVSSRRKGKHSTSNDVSIGGINVEYL
jgi:hypothetical protein